MSRKHLFFSLLVSSAVVGQTVGMKTATKNWDPTICGNPYQGAELSVTKEEKKLALTATKKQAEEEQWDEKKKIMLDWVYALCMAEEKLLSKPFAKWAIADIASCASWLTRLTVKSPGDYRKEASIWKLRTLTADEWKRTQELIQKKNIASMEHLFQLMLKKTSPKLFEKNPWLEEPITIDDEEFFKEAVILFPFPHQIKSALEKALSGAQKKFKLIGKKGSKNAQMQATLALGAKFHYDLVAAHAFDEASKRLGRLCMYLIHRQKELHLAPITDADGYKNALIESLKRKSHVPFVEYYTKIFYDSQSK